MISASTSLGSGGEQAMPSASRFDTWRADARDNAHVLVAPEAAARVVGTAHGFAIDALCRSHGHPWGCAHECHDGCKEQRRE